jgi:hypothetical protein
MCLAAAAHIVEQDRFAELGITDRRLTGPIAQSWQRRDELPSLYGRFDLRYDGTGPAKMLEYNADTPTSLVEAASVQWFWLEDRFPGADQWNSLHERLVAAPPPARGDGLVPLVGRAVGGPGGRHGRDVRVPGPPVAVLGQPPPVRRRQRADVCLGLADQGFRHAARGPAAEPR